MKIINRILNAIARWWRDPDFNRERFLELETKKHIRRGG